MLMENSASDDMVTDQLLLVSEYAVKHDSPLNKKVVDEIEF